jgi:hypothetical protein
VQRIVILLLPLLSLPAFADFNEIERWKTFDSGIRLYVNTPPQLDPQKPTRLILYTTPNGNTLEQTLGAKKREGLDWHYDIQHVAAQTRRLREVTPRENIVLAVAQAPKLSWPAFRQGTPNANALIRDVVTEAARNLPAEDLQITLTGHSGGGSFIFGFINGADAIPANISRIAFLDANYAYDDPKDHHGDKLLAWLNADKTHRLIVIAYDDREITFDGKKVVGPEGGTFRATNRMLTRFKKDVGVTEIEESPFTHYAALNGQLQAFVHRNPENKILHTALVGEMNGLLYALTLGTPEEKTWGAFGGPRAYERWISDQPLRAAIPTRKQNAAAGSAFAARIDPLSPADRENAILQEIADGNLPDFLRCFVPISAQITGKDGKKHTATYFVTPDYLSVGHDKDFFRTPMTPMTAQAIADAFNCSLITRKMSDDIYRAAKVKLAPEPLTVDREAPKTFLQHHALIETQRAATDPTPAALIAGIKKDLVVTNRLSEKPNKVAIYGWHKLDSGQPIQPLTTVHKDTYVDYSHGVRLVSRRVMVDDNEVDLNTVLNDANLSALVSDEGPITARYQPAQIAAPTR